MFLWIPGQVLFVVSNRGLQGVVQRDCGGRWPYQDVKGRQDPVIGTTWFIFLGTVAVVSPIASFYLFLVPGALVHGLGASARPRRNGQNS